MYYWLYVCPEILILTTLHSSGSHVFFMFFLNFFHWLFYKHLENFWVFYFVAFFVCILCIISWHCAITSFSYSDGPGVHDDSLYLSILCPHLWGYSFFMNRWMHEDHMIRVHHRKFFHSRVKGELGRMELGVSKTPAEVQSSVDEAAGWEGAGVKAQGGARKMRADEEL